MSSISLPRPFSPINFLYTYCLLLAAFAALTNTQSLDPDNLDPIGRGEGGLDRRTPAPFTDEGTASITSAELAARGNSDHTLSEPTLDRRAPQEPPETPDWIQCEDDCTTCFAFTDKELPQLVGRSVWQGAPSHIFEKRERKKMDACNGGLKAETRDYLGASDLLKKSHAGGYGVKDTDMLYMDLDNHKTCEDFGFSKQALPKGDKFEGDKAGKVASEHILEAQMLGKFVDDFSKSTKVDDPNSNNEVAPCDLLTKYWSNLPDDKKPADFKLQEIRMKGKYQPWQWVAYGSIPQGKSKDDVFKADEFVFLNQGVNRMKESLWAGHELVDIKNMDKKIKNAKLDACDQAQQGLKSAIEGYRSAFALWKYHQNTKVQEILKKQVIRVRDLFNDLDQTILPKAGTVKINNDNLKVWKPMGIGAKWEAYMQGKLDESISKMDKFLKDYDKKFAEKKKEINDDFNKLAKKDGKTGQKRTDTDRKLMGVQRVMVARIDAANKAYKAKGDLKNWLKA